MSPTPPSWATVRIVLDPAPQDHHELRQATDDLNELAALLADHDRVGGVETIEGGSPNAAPGPALVVYTVPEAIAAIERSAHALAQAFGWVIRTTSEVHVDEQWRDAWKAGYRPLRFGRDDGVSLVLRPSWIARRPSDPRLEIVLDPGRAFGTGLHETTRLCMDVLCQWAGQARPDARVLDLGCGSGILAIAAAVTRPDARIVAVDEDPEATATTTENVQQNGVAERVRVVCGTIDTAPRSSFDLVLANIRTEVLVASAESIAARVGGVLVLSGILVGEDQEVTRAYRTAGLVVVDRRLSEEWCALVLEPAEHERTP